MYILYIKTGGDFFYVSALVMRPPRPIYQKLALGLVLRAPYLSVNERI